MIIIDAFIAYLGAYQLAVIDTTRSFIRSSMSTCSMRSAQRARRTNDPKNIFKWNCAVCSYWQHIMWRLFAALVVVDGWSYDRFSFFAAQKHQELLLLIKIGWAKQKHGWKVKLKWNENKMSARRVHTLNFTILHWNTHHSAVFMLDER